MLKQFLTGSYIFSFLIVSSLSAQAQVPQSTSPSNQPKAPASSQTQPLTQPQTQPQTQISQDELQKFARGLKQLLTIQEGVKQQMAQVVNQSGLSQQRFLQIYQSQKDPSSQPKPAVSSKEKQQFDQAYTKLGEIQKQAQSKMQQAVQKEGLAPARFNQILVMVRQDPALQQKVRQLIQS